MMDGLGIRLAGFHCCARYLGCAGECYDLVQCGIGCLDSCKDARSKTVVRMVDLEIFEIFENLEFSTTCLAFQKIFSI